MSNQANSFGPLTWHVCVALCGFLLLLTLPRVVAFPPAPHHLIFGTVRDELGHPIVNTNASIRFETLSGVTISTAVSPSYAPGINYQLTIPMDSGLTADAYKAHALQPTVPFRIKVQIDGVNYAPIEMTGDYASLGNPAKKTRIDLTLGVDSDGDGLPDAWERMILALSGGGTLADLNPSLDTDGDGLSNLAEYIAGTYANDPDDGFMLEIKSVAAQGPLLDFLAIRNRTYQVQGSADFKNWTVLNFRFSGETPQSPSRRTYQAADERMVTVQPVIEENSPMRFFKLQVH